MNLFNRQRPGFFIAQSHHKGIWHGNRAGGYRLMTGDRPSGSPPRVADLKQTFGAVLMDGIRQLCHSRNIFVIINDQHTGGIQTHRRIHTGYLHHDKADSALRPFCIMVDHRLIDKALIGLAHSHGTHNRLVTDFQRTDSAGR